MSIETEIQALSAAVRELTAALTRAPAAPVIHVNDTLPGAVAAPPAPVATPAAPVMPPMPFTNVAAPPVFAMPAAPVAPAPVAPAPTALPFSDTQGAVQWTVQKFQQLGPRGSEIQKVLAGLGLSNITAIKPEQFQALVDAVEAIK